MSFIYRYYLYEIYIKKKEKKNQQQKIDYRNAEETEKFNKKMEEERARQKKAETECERIGELLKQITKVLGKLFDKLQVSNSF